MFTFDAYLRESKKETRKILINEMDAFIKRGGKVTLVGQTKYDDLMTTHKKRYERSALAVKVRKAGDLPNGINFATWRVNGKAK